MTLVKIDDAGAMCSGSNFPQVSLWMEIHRDDAGAGVDIANNREQLWGRVYLYRGGTGGQNTANQDGNCKASAVADGTTRYSATNLSYTFRGADGMGDVGDLIILWQGYFNVPHLADGTKTLNYSATWDSPPGDILGDVTVSGSVVLPLIPRNRVLLGDELSGSYVEAATHVGVNGAWRPALVHLGDGTWKQVGA